MGTKAAIFLPFLMSWTRAHFRMAELGCLASIPLQSRRNTHGLQLPKISCEEAQQVERPAEIQPIHQQCPAKS